MTDSTFKIINKTQNEDTTTVVYLCPNDPVQESLFQCSYSQVENEFLVTEHLQYCIKSEDFLDIQGLYSKDLQQNIITSLNNHVT